MHHLFMLKMYSIMTRWTLELPGREHIVPQTFSFLLMKSLHEEVTAASVKRVYALRDALLVLDLDSEESNSLKVRVHNHMLFHKPSAICQ